LRFGLKLHHYQHIAAIKVEIISGFSASPVGDFSSIVCGAFPAVWPVPGELHGYSKTAIRDGAVGRIRFESSGGKLAGRAL
jgi:hypothetical protein